MTYALRLSILSLVLVIPLAIYTSPIRWPNLESVIPSSYLETSLAFRKLFERGRGTYFRRNVSMAHHFRQTQKYKIEYSPQTLTEYVSGRTGMRIVVTDQAGPKVHGTFLVATEILDDSGAPHTLEHLCFLGSRSYGYKGLLDKVAQRLYSNTNAWTATDHTAYTLETAGYAAFAGILPMYLEHVLLPTLTDAGCYTEVFHIDGSGHDAGVVYSEMQGVQNSQGELMELRGKRLMYPPDNGFRYETGGMMEHLRVLTADRIRQFHRDMYQPRNLCLLITGEIDHEHLLTTLESFEESVLPHLPKETQTPFRRPWLDSPQPPALKESTVEVVEFPEEKESFGEVSVKYFGPPVTDQVRMTAMAVLLGYLAASSASVLENIIVEREQLATAVFYSVTPRPDSVIEFNLSGVAASQLAAVEQRFVELLRETSAGKLDMAYMRDCLDQERRRQMFQAENSADFFSSGALTTELFARDRNLEYLSHLREFDDLSHWSEEQWLKLMKDWLVDANRITILGRPSAALAAKLKSEEERRVAEQIKKLGESGLRELGEKLKKATAENDRPIPNGMLDSYKIPPTDTIHFVHTTPARSGSAKDLGRYENPIQDVINKEKSTLPLFLQFEHIPSNFVNINLLISTSAIEVSLRPLLAVYMENFFNTPIMKDGKRMEFEDVVKHLERETVGYKMGSASEMGNSELLRVSFQVERSKYSTAIQSIKDLMWNSIFDVERIMSTTARLLTDVHEEKRSGTAMVYSTAAMVNEAPASLPRARDTLVKALYLKRVKRLLATDPDKVLSDLEHIREALCQPSNFRILVLADVEKLPSPVRSWEALSNGHDLTRPLAPLESRVQKLSKAGKNPGNISYIVSLPTIDSSFALAVAKGPDSSKDPRIPALMVATAYLDAVEGPLWDAVRGAGLAYGTSFRWRYGNIEFSVYRSPDAFKAFAAARKVIEGYVSRETKFDALALEGAISSIVLSIASAQATMAEAAADSFVHEVINDLPRDWNEIFLGKVRSVTVDEIREALKALILPTFRPESTNLFVTCAPVMEEVRLPLFLVRVQLTVIEIGKGLLERGFQATGQAIVFLPGQLRT